MRRLLVTTFLCAGLAALLVVNVAGCRRGKYKIVPVEGKLVFEDGKPLPTGTGLIFNPGEGGVGTAKGVVTGSDGSFTVTHVKGAGGAEVGKYSVLLVAPEGSRDSFYLSIPKEYYDGGALFVEVKEGMQPVELKVKRK